MEHNFLFNRLVVDLLGAISKFLGTVPGSLKGHLNTEELLRIAVTALTAGGGFFGVLQAVLVGVGTIFPAPSDAALAAAVLTVILETHRRLRHGADLKAVLPPGRLSQRPY